MKDLIILAAMLCFLVIGQSSQRDQVTSDDIAKRICENSIQVGCLQVKTEQCLKNGFTKRETQMKGSELNSDRPSIVNILNSTTRNTSYSFSLLWDRGKIFVFMIVSWLNTTKYCLI